VSLPRLSLILVALSASDDAVAAALESIHGQLEGAQVILVGRTEALAERLAGFKGGYEALELPEASPAEARNAALERARSPLVAVVDGHERVSAGALQRHVEALEAEPQLVGSYGRTAVHEKERVRERPDHGKGGTLFRRLLKVKHLIASSAALVWRRDALGAAPFEDYRAPESLRLSFALELAREDREFVFQPAVVAERSAEALDVDGLEELVRVLVGVVYAPEPLEERVEQRARRRLARRLVAIGKHHYRLEDYGRAGRFFDQAVKAAPAYFRGRRYQFLNFVKNTLSKE
jgi:tetratricopeptide (TPR) repeat protein